MFMPRWQSSWGQNGAHLGPAWPQMGPMLAPWTLLSGWKCCLQMLTPLFRPQYVDLYYKESVLITSVTTICTVMLHLRSWMEFKRAWFDVVEYHKTGHLISWRRHQMETFSTLLYLSMRNSPVTGEFPSQRPVTRSFDVLFDLRLNKCLSKHLWGWWLETPSCSLWCHCNVILSGVFNLMANVSLAIL